MEDQNGGDRRETKDRDRSSSSDAQRILPLVPIRSISYTSSIYCYSMGTKDILVSFIHLSNNEATTFTSIQI